MKNCYKIPVTPQAQLCYIRLGNWSYSTSSKNIEAYSSVECLFLEKNWSSYSKQSTQLKYLSNSNLLTAPLSSYSEGEFENSDNSSHTCFRSFSIQFSGDNSLEARLNTRSFRFHWPILSIPQYTLWNNCGQPNSININYPFCPIIDKRHGLSGNWLFPLCIKKNCDFRGEIPTEMGKLFSACLFGELILQKYQEE